MLGLSIDWWVWYVGGPLVFVMLCLANWSTMVNPKTNRINDYKKNNLQFVILSVCLSVSVSVLKKHLQFPMPPSSSIIPLLLLSCTLSPLKIAFTLWVVKANNGKKLVQKVWIIHRQVQETERVNPLLSSEFSFLTMNVQTFDKIFFLNWLQILRDSAF